MSAASATVVARVAHKVEKASRKARSAARQRRNPGDLSGSGFSPWPDLPLEVIYGKAPACRLRQHVNPLRAEHQALRAPPDWAAVFTEPRLPLVLDVGCAGGRFALAMACRAHDRNFLGLDLRRPLIERANEWASELRLAGRAFFAQANATVALEAMLAGYPGSLELAAIQFPDPHFKNRHKKRRIVQQSLIDALAKLMAPRGQVFLQSDVEAVTAAMRDEFELFGSRHFALDPAHDFEAHLVDGAVLASSLPEAASRSEARLPASEGGRRDPESPCDAGDRLSGAWEGPAVSGRSLEARAGLQWGRAGYLASNPFGVPTEREVQTTIQNDPVFRVLLVRR